jgi:DNA-binding NarL/FixJ family response regulator
MLLSLKRLLEPEFEVAAMADNVLSLLDALKEIAPDLLVLDTGSAEFGDLPRRLRARHPHLCILLVGDCDSCPEAETPARTAYVSKHAAEQQLIPAARMLVGKPPCPGHDGQAA